MGTAQALEYYYIEPTTGRITLKKLLTEGTQSEDRVTRHIYTCRKICTPLCKIKQNKKNLASQLKSDCCLKSES